MRLPLLDAIMVFGFDDIQMATKGTILALGDTTGTTSSIFKEKRGTKKGDRLEWH
jgi:fibrillarin-like rRNA methylase